MRRAFAILSLILAAAAPADPVPVDMQQKIIAHFSPAMVLPQTTIWHFDRMAPFVLGGVTVCGRVNYQNSTKKYLGLEPFYAVVQDGAVNDGGISSNDKLLDPEGSVAFSYKQHCGDGGR